MVRAAGARGFHLSRLGRCLSLNSVFAPHTRSKALADKLRSDIVRRCCPGTGLESQAVLGDVNRQTVRIRLAPMAAYFNEELAEHCHGITLWYT